LSQRILDELQLSQRRLTTMDGLKVNYEQYLRKNVDSDSDSEDEYSDDDDSHLRSDSENSPKILKLINDQTPPRVDMVILSDTEDSNSNYDSEDSSTSEKVVVHGPNNVTEINQNKLMSTKLKKKFMFPTTLDDSQNHFLQVNPVNLTLSSSVSARVALKKSLFKKVLVASKDNLCKQMNIQSNQLNLYKELMDKCRYDTQIDRFNK
jgi:hypothetical protein